MDVVVDANVLFSAAIKDSATAELLLRDDLDCYGPEYLFEEFVKHRGTVLERTHRSTEDFEGYVRFLQRRISVVPRDDFVDHEAHARRISPDPGDVPYLALALSLEAFLWSDDKALQDQDTIPVYTTTGLLERLGS